jgi:hypothetical protein
VASVTEDEALQHLQAILSRPEFQTTPDTPWWQQLLTPILEFLWNTLSQFIALVVQSSTGREGSIGAVVVVACAIAILAAGVYLVRAIRLSVVRESVVRQATLAERRTRSDQLWQDAQRSAERGDFAEALRLAYLSALYALDEHALLQVEFTLTNREHAARLRARAPALGDALSELVASYDRVRYGHTDVPEATFTSFTARAATLRQAALQRRAA